MKNTSMALVITGLISSSAFAQSSVTLYGIIDTGMRYVSSDNAAGDSNVKLVNSAITASRIGFKGSEDLGAGNKINFRLENGFNPDTGNMSSPGVLFNRQSWVGIDGSHGQFSLGRQNTAFFDLIAGHFDPLSVGSYDSNSWLPVGAALVRTSNMLKYYGSADGLSVGLSYAMGEQATSFRSGSQTSASLQYTTGNLSFGGAFQQTISTTNSANRAQAYNLSASYALGNAKLYGGYYKIKDSTGLYTTAKFAANNSLAANSDGIPGVERRDTAFFLGVKYALSPVWSLRTAAYYDTSKNVSTTKLGNIGNGKRYALVAIPEYALSKRTQLYGTIDYNKVKGATSIELADGNHQTGLSVGIRHLF